MPTAQCSFLHTSTARHIQGLAHKIDSCRLCIKCSERAHDPIPTNTTHCVSLGFCKNETNAHTISSRRRYFQCCKCARCPTPTFTHGHDKPYGAPSARSLSATRCKRVERGQVARCNQCAPRLERCKHGVYVTAYRSSPAAIMSRPEPRPHSAPSYSCKCMGKASRGIRIDAEHYKKRLFATVRSTPPPLRNC